MVEGHIVRGAIVEGCVVL
jgi:hypothetical protein